MSALRTSMVAGVLFGAAAIACSSASKDEGSGAAGDGGGETASIDAGSPSSHDASTLDGSSSRGGDDDGSSGDDDDAEASADSGSGASTCSCAYNQRCVGSSQVCTTVPVMSLGISVSYSGSPAMLTGSSEVEFISGPQYDSYPDGGAISYQTSSVDGCSVTTSSAQSGAVFHGNTYAANAGTVTVSGGPNGNDVFTLFANEAGTNDLYSGSLGTTPVYTGEATLGVTGTGGADFPGFSTTLTTRAPVQITGHGPFSVGGTFDVEWSGTHSGSTINVSIATDRYTAATMTYDNVSISCDVPDNGSFTFPADVTSHLQSTYDTALLQVVSTQQIRLAPTTKNVLIYVDTQTSAAETLN